jgi:enamine deaminase RidA (YjgF/YER057c/UK114 family)
VRVDDRVYVSGTAPIAEDGSTAYPGDSYRQAKHCLEIIERALHAAGATTTDVVRTRVYISDPSAYDGVARAHGEVFGEIRPASTMVVCKLLRDDWLVEIEADAVIT